MNFKDVAVKNEQKLRIKNERLKTLLYNAIIMLEEQYSTPMILEQFGMTEKEYFEIMGDNFDE